MQRLQQLTKQSKGKYWEKDKASVLHDAADELERLHAELAEAKAGEEVQRRRAEQLSAVACMCRMDARRTLHGLALLRSRICVVLLSERGVLLDVSERVLEGTGWQRECLEGSSVGRENEPAPKSSEVCPLWIRVPPLTTLSLQYLKQYPASKKRLNALLAGDKQRMELQIRMWTASGQTVEAACTAWRVDFGESDAQGSMQNHVVFTWALDDCLEVAFPCASFHNNSSSPSNSSPHPTSSIS